MINKIRTCYCFEIELNNINQHSWRDTQTICRSCLIKADNWGPHLSGTHSVITIVCFTLGIKIILHLLNLKQLPFRITLLHVAITEKGRLFLELDF